MNKDTKEHLDEMGKNHNPSKVQPRDQKLPDGDYIAKITEAGFKLNRDRDSFGFIFKFVAVGGACDGWKFSKFCSKLREYSSINDSWFENIDKCDRLTQDFHCLGIRLEAWSNFEQSHEDKLGTLTVSVSLKTVSFDGGEYQFVNINNVVDKGAKQAPADDDIPF